jgi:predicted metal-dependent hydrolase
MKILKSFRKTMTIKIDEAGNLIVKAPYLTSKKKVEDFVNKHKKWIDNKTKTVLKKVKKYNEKEKFMFF